MRIKVFVGTSGKVQSVFSDLLELRTLGKAEIRRAGYVEPYGNLWKVTLADGTELGHFWHREDAVGAEEQEVVRRLSNGSGN